MNRRHFLKALGLSGAVLASGRPAWTMDEAPRRLIVLSSTQGTVPAGVRTNPADLPEETAWSQDLVSAPETAFGPALAPLFPHRSRLLLLDGISMISAELDANGDRHQKGWLHAWTGAWADFRGGVLSATAPSLDQLVAREIARPDRLPSLELAVGQARPVSHAGPGQQLPMEGDPGRAFQRLFGGRSDPQLALRSSVLDFVLEEHRALAPRLTAADRTKLDTHFSLVRQLEERLQGLASVSCAAPGVPEPVDHRTTFSAQAELVAAAFACDLTRVATLSLGDVPPSEIGVTQGSGDLHNDYAHRVHESAAAAEVMIAAQRFEAEQIASLIRTLEAIPEAGGSVMDHTLIVWGNEVGDGWHGYHRYAPVLIGGSWFFRPGRVVHWPWDTVPISVVVPGGRSPGAGIPHHRVLVSAAQAMGLATDHVGLDSIHDDLGVPLDLRGTLQELT